MYIIYIDNYKYHYELQTLAEQFLGKSQFEISEVASECIENSSNIFHLKKQDNDVVINGLLAEKNIELRETIKLHEKTDKNAYKRALYRLLSKISQRNLDWGILTGIRPTKLYREVFEYYSGNKQIADEFANSYFVSKNKLDLLIKIYEVQRDLLKDISRDDFSVYISVPFCPTRCNYCTFFSNEILKKSHLVPKYLETIKKELQSVFSEKWVKKRGISTVYIGGGTPSSLSYGDMKKFLDIISEVVDFRNVKEVTFEAGRPDTIDTEKLELIKSYGIDRISINPQSMIEKTLNHIGRNHTQVDIIKAYNLSRKVGFGNINMDIILGLENEGINELEYTLIELLRLNPDSITVHSLALKKASDLSKVISDDIRLNQSKNVIEMMKYILEKMPGDYIPYYLYRQKNILGGQENIGFSKIGKSSLYNIIIIEEYQNILAFGPGAISRFVYSDENRIEKISNAKNLELYIKDIDLMIANKKQEMGKYEY